MGNQYHFLSENIKDKLLVQRFRIVQLFAYVKLITVLLIAHNHNPLKISALIVKIIASSSSCAKAHALRSVFRHTGPSRRIDCIAQAAFLPQKYENISLNTLFKNILLLCILV